MRIAALSRGDFKRLRPRLASSLAFAFQDDPGIRYIFNREKPNPESLVGLYNILLDYTYRYGVIGASQDGSVASLWRLPGAIHDSPIRRVLDAPKYVATLGKNVFRANTLDASIARNHPSYRYLYLHILGCHPDGQGQGLARETIEFGKELAREYRLPIFLETSLHSNIPLYRHLGFEETHRWFVPNGGPEFIGMQLGNQ